MRRTLFGIALLGLGKRATGQPSRVEVEPVRNHFDRPDRKEPGLLRRLIDWTFGYDFFISYAHGDGQSYPARLKAQLEREGRDFTAFLDRDVYTAGDELNRATRRRVRMSRELVVVCRPQALKSHWVGKEVDAHLESGRVPLLINVNGALQDAEQDSPLARMAIDRDWIRVEESIADPDGEPSENCLAELSRAFKSTRQQTRRLRFFASAAVVFALVAAAALAFGVSAVQSARQSDMRGLLRGAETAGESNVELSLLLLAEAVDVQRAGALPDHEIVAALHSRLRNASARAVRLGAWGGVQQLRFGPDGARFVSASSDGTLRLWTPDGAEPQRVLRGHTGSITAIEFDPTGKLLASASSDRTIRLWNLAQGSEPRVLEGHVDSVASLAFNRDGAKLVSAGYDGTVRVWDLRQGDSSILLRGHDRPEIFFAAFDPTGQYVVSTSRDKTARLWHLGDGHAAAVLKGHTDDVTHARFNVDGSLLVTASADGAVLVWNMPMGRLVRELAGKSRPTAIEFSPDGRTLLVGRRDGSLQVWSTANLTDSTTMQAEGPRALAGHEGAIAAIRFSEDGSSLITVGGRSIRVWTIQDGWSKQGQWMLGVPGVSLASINRQGAHVVTASGGGEIRVWKLAEQPTHVARWTKGWASEADLSLDDKRAVVVDDGRAVVVEFRSDKEALVLPNDQDEVQRVRFSPDGRHVLTASRSATLRLWSLDGSLVHAFEGHDDRIFDLAFDRSSKHLASASADRTAIVWDTSAAAPPVVLRGHLDRVLSVSFSPDGTRVLTSSGDGTARLWDAYKGIEVTTLRGHWDIVARAVFSPDGRRVATASADRTARVWNLDNPSRSVVFEHRGEVESVSFSPDGRFIVTTSRDGNAHIWNADGSSVPIVLGGMGAVAGDAFFTADGARVVVYTNVGVFIWRADGVGEPIMLAAPSPLGRGTAKLGADKQTAMTASGDGLATWTLSASALRDAACHVAGRNLTAAEWSLHRSGPYRKTCPQWPDLGSWISPDQNVVADMRVLSSSDKPTTSRIFGRDVNLLFPRELRGIIRSIQPSLGSVTAGQICSATLSARVADKGQVLCNARIECSGQLMYGGSDAGHFPCALAGSHVRGSDAQTSSADQDPAITLDTESNSLHIWDDQAGYFGRFDMYVELERPRPPPGFVSSVPWGCIDGTGLAPSLPAEANRHLQSWLVPDRSPFVIDEILYSLVAPADSLCRSGLAHDVVVGAMRDPGPGNRDQTGAAAVTLRIPAIAERSLRRIHVPIDPPIRLEAGQAAFVRIQLAADSDARYALCVQTCRTGGYVGIDYLSDSATPPYRWNDVVVSKSLIVNHAVYGIDRATALAVDRLLELPGYSAPALDNFARSNHLVTRLQSVLVTEGPDKAWRLAYGRLSVETARHAARASNESLIESFKATKKLLEVLRDENALSCAQEIFPQIGPPPDLSPGTKELWDAVLKSQSDIVVSAERRPRAQLNSDAAQQTLRRAATALGSDARYLAPPSALPNDAEARAICTAFIRFYDHILADEPSLAANAIRTLYMVGAAARAQR